MTTSDTQRRSNHTFLKHLHESCIQKMQTLDQHISIKESHWQHRDSGGGISVVLTQGKYIEKAGLNFSSIEGKSLPKEAFPSHSQISSDTPYYAMGVSCIVHPLNPNAPTSHMNVRYFALRDDPVTWWFGGGFDLTPCIGYEDDARKWHQACLNSCESESQYRQWKDHCDRYFYLPHRKECRGIGGIFFDQYNLPNFKSCQHVWKSVGRSWLEVYTHILEKRMHQPFSDQDRNFQNMRRGRYVEFNLLYDRGTRFGLNAGGNIDSILSSMPPVVNWPVCDDLEQRSLNLSNAFLKPRDWL